MTGTPKIGAFVLETLTTGMYTNPLDTIRELVQNASDSIRGAEAAGILGRGEGRIEVILDAKERTLSIRDNGLGISRDAIHSKLLNIGMSDKKIGEDAGFRGIGRLAAMAYCRRLHFQTSTVDEDVVSRVEMDCLGLRRAVLPSMRQVEELSEVIERSSATSEDRASKDCHFFAAIMEDISVATPMFLDIDALEDYLCQVAPIELDSQHFIFKPKISQWQRRFHLDTPTITLVLKSPEQERQVFKPHKTYYKTEDGKFGFDIKDIAFYPESPTPETAFWIWYGVTDLLGMVGDPRVAGLRFRKNNIAIGGPERVAELFSALSRSYDRLNAWYIGEIHIISSAVVPNARRDGFEDNEIWCAIKDQLMPFIRERRVAAYDTSQNRNRPIPKVVDTAQRTIVDATSRLTTGFVSDKERQRTLDQIAREHDKATRVFEAQKEKKPKEAAVLPPIIQELGEVKTKIEEERSFAVKNIRSNLDRKQRKLLHAILQILYETLDEVNFRKAKDAILKKFTIG